MPHLQPQQDETIQQLSGGGHAAANGSDSGNRLGGKRNASDQLIKKQGTKSRKKAIPADRGICVGQQQQRAKEIRSGQPDKSMEEGDVCVWGFLIFCFGWLAYMVGRSLSAL